MRDPFPYESNVSLIRDILVPEPLSTDEWQGLLAGWQDLRGSVSLLEYLARHRFREDELLEILGNCLGVRVFSKAEFLADDELDATEQLLRKQGFEILKSKQQRKLVTGGPAFNPDMEKYLGPSQSGWEWVLTSPARVKSITGQGSFSGTPATQYGISKWLETLIGGLWSGGARDIHFEREGDALRVRTHMETGMQTVGRFTDGRASTVTRLLCTWSGISTWNRQSFADGSLSLPGNSGLANLRLSAVPTVTGESLVLRAPGPGLNKATLDRLGIPAQLKDKILDVALNLSGMIICTGPTGSGKTTTLYGILNELAGSNLKILTIEDPVEQIIPYTVQSLVDDKNGWTFERAIHAFLRQDPDVIMVGEIRDAISAQAACRAALTGHCVLTTMHARDVQSALERLKAWGVAAGIIAESIRLIIHQQLRCSPEKATIHVAFKWESPIPDSTAQA